MNNDRLVMLVLVLVVVLGGVVRCWGLGAQPLYYDEIVSWSRAVMPIPQSLTATIQTDTMPPLYYTVMHLVAQFGEGEAWLRLPSAVAGTLLILVVYLLARRIAGGAVALVAAAFIAVSPIAVMYSQEARMYSFYALSAGLAMLGLWSLTADADGAAKGPGAGASVPHRERLGWWLYVLGTTAVLYLHNTGVFFFVAANLVGFFWVLSARGGRIGTRLRSWMLTQLIIVLLWLPWWPFLLHQAQGAGQGFWFDTSWRGLLDCFNDLWLGLIWRGRPWWILVPLAAAVYLSWVWRRSPFKWVFLVTLAVAPPLVQYVVSQWQPVLVTRGVLYAMVPLSIILAAAALKLPRRSLVVAAVVAVLALNLWGVRVYFQSYEKERWDQVADLLVRENRPGDLILISNHYLDKALNYYLHRSAPTLSAIPFPRARSRVAESDRAALAELAGPRPRVWLVTGHTAGSDTQARLTSWLAEFGEQRRHAVFRGTGMKLSCPRCIEVFLFESQPH